MITEAAIAICLSFTTQCHSMDEVIAVVKAHREELGVIYLRERLVIGDGAAPDRIPDDCSTGLWFLGTEPYDVWLCRKIVPVS